MESTRGCLRGQSFGTSEEGYGSSAERLAELDAIQVNEKGKVLLRRSLVFLKNEERVPWAAVSMWFSRFSARGQTARIAGEVQGDWSSFMFVRVVSHMVLPFVRFR